MKPEDAFGMRRRVWYRTVSNGQIRLVLAPWGLMFLWYTKERRYINNPLHMRVDWKTREKSTGASPKTFSRSHSILTRAKTMGAKICDPPSWRLNVGFFFVGANLWSQNIWRISSTFTSQVFEGGVVHKLCFKKVKKNLSYFKIND